jgi:hypothetical protein
VRGDRLRLRYRGARGVDLLGRPRDAAACGGESGERDDGHRRHAL